MIDGLPSVLALIGDQYHGSNWWRTVMPYSFLQRRGVNAVWAENVDPSAAMETGIYDIIIFYSLAFPDARSVRKYVRTCHKFGKTVLFDTDDDLLTYIDYMAEAWLDDKQKQFAQDRPRIRMSMKGVDGVTASCGHLAARVGDLTKKPVAIVPNLLDMEWWAMTQGIGKRLSPTDKTVIGWVGARRNENDLGALAEAWARVANLRPETHFLIAGWPAPPLVDAVPADRTTLIPWTSIETYPLSYLSLDIGCCPLAPTGFNLSKSPIKAIECGATGIPAVCSPTVYGTALDNILIARNADEWTEHLLRLVDDREYREAQGQRLNNEVWARHSLQRNWLKIVSGWQSLVDQSRARAGLEVLTLDDAEVMMV